MNIVHFDIDSAFAPHFRETKYRFALNSKNISKVKNPALIDIVSIKSSSSLTSAVIKKLPALKAIFARTVGFNNIDLKYCKNQNIGVFHIPDYGSFAIAEHVFALLLAKARKIVDLQVDIKNGKFHYAKGQGFSLQDKTIGVIGVGNIGQEVVKIARGFQMHTYGFDIKKSRRFSLKTGLKYVSLETLLQHSDIIVLTVNLNPHTRHLIDEKAIKKIKPKAVLINVSRGEIIDTKALVKNIKKFRFVGLDVLEEETKFSKNHELLKHKNVLITPHIAFFTDRTTTQIAMLTNRNIQAFIDGKASNQVI